MVDHNPKKRMEKVINIKMPEDLLKRIDERANRLYISRTSWIRLKLSEVLDELDKKSE